MQSLVYSADYDFQVLAFLPLVDNEKAWNYANNKAEAGEWKKIKVEHYDVMTFKDPAEMNKWIREQVAESRIDKKDVE